MAVKKFNLIIGVVTVLITIIAIYNQSRIAKENNKQLLIIAVENLVAQEKPDINSPAIHNKLKELYQNNISMNGIVLRSTKFLMAEFENVCWQEADMEAVEFSCSDQAYDNNWDAKDRNTKILPCARLKKADFTGASLRKIRFSYADLRGANFTAADLTKAKIKDSVVSGAKFLEEVDLRGIKIKNSDFTHTQIGPKAKFFCTVGNNKCPKLRLSDFSSAVMNDVVFRGVEVDQVDFTGAKLKDASFDCERARDGKKSCTVLKNLCVQGKDTDLTKSRFEGVEILSVNFIDANLSKTRFKNTKISNTDFTGADLSGARFTNVEFVGQVELTKEQEMLAKFDKDSHSSLEESRREKLDLEYVDEIPCSTEWRLDIKGWKDRFELSG